ncbi:MAG: hypothetical protein PWQ77_1670 [Kosmotogales bacterium]|nr:hypothetical protein [Kosmotogales bacterium]
MERTLEEDRIKKEFEELENKEFYWKLFQLLYGDEYL